MLSTLMTTYTTTTVVLACPCTMASNTCQPTKPEAAVSRLGDACHISAMDFKRGIPLLGSQTLESSASELGGNFGARNHRTLLASMLLLVDRLLETREVKPRETLLTDRAADATDPTPQATSPSSSLSI